MREILCSNCGQRIPAGESCRQCDRFTAITSPEHPTPAKVTPPREEEPPRSIHKEFHYSLGRILLGFLLFWMVVIAIIVFFAAFGR